MTQATTTKPEIFSVWSDEIENRLDPLFYAGDILSFIRHSKFEIVELSSVITFIKTGFAAGKQNQSENKDGIVQIRPTNIDEFGNLKFDKIITLPSNLLDERAEDIIQKNEVLFNNTNSQELVGKSAYFDIDGTYFCSNHITRIKTDEKKLLPKFLWLLLNTYQVKKVFYKICVNWNNQSGVNVELLKTLQIPLPSLQKQREAIEFVHNAYHEKSKKEEEIKQILASIDNFVLSELGIEIPEGGVRRVFEVWSNEIKERLDPSFYIPLSFTVDGFQELKNYLDVQGGFAFKSKEYVDDGIPLVRIQNLIDGKVDLSDTAYIKPKYQEILKRFLLKDNDLLIAMTGATIGKTAIIDKDKLPAFLNQRVGRFIINDKKIDKNYLFIIMQTKIFMEQIKKLSLGGAQPNISPESIGKIKIPVPSYEKQKNIVNEVFSKYEKVSTLRAQAVEVLAGAQKQVEQMILA